MKILLTCLFAAFMVPNAIAQKAPIKFGEIPMGDLIMVKYDKDSSAAAVVLADFGTSSLIYNQSDDNFSLVFDRIIRLKILSKDGLDWATFTVPLYHEGGANEKFSSLKAVTYNLENKNIVESKLKNDGIFKERVNENVDYMKFTLPNARQGSVLEISYKVTSDFLFNFQDWEFQRSIPTRWSEYRANIPEYYYYEKFTQGYVALVLSETKQRSASITLTSTERGSVGFNSSTQSTTSVQKVDYMENQHRWAAQDVPAFKPEPYITTSTDYISKINFELSYLKFPGQALKPIMGTWGDINTKYFESEKFGREIAGNGFLKKITEQVIAGLAEPEQKINAISNYVKQNIEWNGYSLKFTDSPFKKVLEDKKGSSAEINLLMASMLEKAGFDVSPVLVSTRDHGFIRETIPVSSQFNYVICLVKVGEKSFLLDATDRFLTTGALPERCLNGSGFVVGENGFMWIPLKSNLKSRHVYNADLSLTADGELKGKLQLDRTGYFARSGRKNYLSKGEGNYVKDLVGNHAWTVAKSQFFNTKEVSETFKEIHEVVINDHVVSADAIIYLNPFVGMQEKENPFKTENRLYPVDFGSPEESIYICKITIPNGYVVDEMPQSKLLKLPDNSAKYTYSLTQTGNVLSLTSHLQINNSLFSQLEYPNLREFYNQVVAKQAEQIVLKKK